MSFSVSDIENIFNIPKDGSNINDDDNDMELSSNDNDLKTSFSEKAKLVEMDIANIKEGKSLEKPTEPKIEVTKITETVPSIEDIVKQSKPKTDEPNLFEESKIVQKDVTQVVENKQLVETVKSEIKTEKNIINSEGNEGKKTKLECREVEEWEWKISDENAEFSDFYRHKADALENHLLVGGEIPFERFETELVKARVDISLTTYDLEGVNQKMQEVQKWRDRIQEIQLRTNRQYFLWKRFVDVLKDVLASVEYRRGKQGSVVAEHMFDMEAYFGRLESLNENVFAVMKNLDSCFGCLSRQVAIAMPNAEVTRYERNKTLDNKFGTVQPGTASTQNNKKNVPQTNSWDL